MLKIRYKSFYSDWKVVDKEQAIKIANHLFYNGVTNSNKKVDYINSRFQGIRFKLNNNKIEVIGQRLSLKTAIKKNKKFIKNT